MPARSLSAGVAAAVALSALSAVWIPLVPSYDPWAWLLWGREVAHGTLSTAEGPAFKPLPAGVAALLTALGDAAAPVWVLLARAAALVGVGLAFVAGRRWAGSAWAAAVGAIGVAATGSYLGLGATGSVEGLFLALALGALLLWQDGRHRTAWACALAAALLRVEAWPFLVAALTVAPARDRRLFAATAVAVPALWLVPELLGSGELLRSADRARIPNPGQPALDAVPAWASLQSAAGLAVWPLVAVAALAPARARIAAAAGVAWVGLVAAMAELGFSGEPRYALPGVALVTVAGAAALARPRPLVCAAVALAAVVVAAPRLTRLPDIAASQRRQAALADGLDRAIAAAGGRERLLACGPPVVGPLRGPLLAYKLRVEKRAVVFIPAAVGVAFLSRRVPTRPVEPSTPRTYVRPAAAGGWTVVQACRDPDATS